MTSISKPLAQLEARLDGLTLRERGIVTGALACLLLFLAIQFGLSPLWHRIQVQQAQTEQFSQEASLLASQVAALQQRLAEDPNRLLRERQEALSRQLAQETETLQGRMGSLIKPEDMAHLLEQLLAQSPGLSVVGLDKLPARAMTVTDGRLVPYVPPKTSPGPKADPQVIYRHGLRLTLEGGYLDTLAYIKRLEAMDRTLLVNRLDFHVLQYPESRAVLEVETLSLLPGWLGVVK